MVKVYGFAYRLYETLTVRTIEVKAKDEKAAAAKARRWIRQTFGKNRGFEWLGEASAPTSMKEGEEK